MLNAERIELIRHRHEVQNDFGWNTSLLKALDVAIEALNLIPDNATNGDVIEALFPNAEYCTNEYSQHFVRLKGFDIKAEDSWWNAPYKAESENKEGESE